MKKLFLIISLFAALSAHAQKQVTDTTKKNLGDTIKKDLLTAPDTVKKLHSNPLSLVPPAAMIAYGGLSFAVHPIRRFDYYIRGEVAKTSPNFHSTAESYFQFAPVVIVYGLNLAGVRGKNTFIDRSALLGLSASILGITAFATKHFTHRLRPNGANYLSFPSGHTATAFMGAEFMAQEYDAKSPLYGVLAYSIATTTGVFRMYNRDHWFSDVVAGAGLGILSTKAAYLVYPAIRNWLTHGDEKAEQHNRRKKSRYKNALLSPSFDNGSLGLSFYADF